MDYNVNVVKRRRNRMRTKLFSLFTILILFTLFTGACAGPACGGTEWQDVTWKLKAYGNSNNLQTVIGSGITIEFVSKDKSVSGNTGINEYGGTFTVNKDCKLSISNMAWTLIGSSDANLTKQENDYLKLLQTTDKIEIINGELNINCGQGLLVFTR
jgi:heat shock protein HslJ